MTKCNRHAQKFSSMSLFVTLPAASLFPKLPPFEIKSSGRTLLQVSHQVARPQRSNSIDLLTISSLINSYLIWFGILGSSPTPWDTSWRNRWTPGPACAGSDDWDSCLARRALPQVSQWRLPKLDYPDSPTLGFITRLTDHMLFEPSIIIYRQIKDHDTPRIQDVNRIYLKHFGTTFVAVPSLTPNIPWFVFFLGDGCSWDIAAGLLQPPIWPGLALAALLALAPWRTPGREPIRHSALPWASPEATTFVDRTGNGGHRAVNIGIDHGLINKQVYFED